ncbi:MAG: AlpA family transcriptional regulator [Spirochaetes bacterium]|nr:MAG: AlpA family transcriptional regulator [Spirochaetota bacterium]
MKKTTDVKIKLLRRPDVEAMTGLRRSSIYEMMQDNTFPKPVQLNKRMVGWVESEIEGWLEEKIAERDGVKKKKKKND